MAISVLPEHIINKIQNVFSRETKDKITKIRAKFLYCKEEKADKELNFEEVYVFFHSLKGTGKSIGFDKITDIATEALDAILKAINNQISLKLFKAKIEANLCEIEDLLPGEVKEGVFDEVQHETTLGTVLVVDDDVSLTQAIKERLAIDGFKVLGVSSLEDATAYLDLKQPIDLMIIDIILPEGNGFDLCLKIRKEKNYEDTPIIFLTAETSLEKKLRSFELGADDYIVKPFLLEEMAAKVRAIVARTRNYKNKLLYDDLTKAYSRSFLQVKTDEEIARSRRTGNNFTLCLLDLDYFKNINDGYGHQAGDQVLVQFVQFLQERTRDTDAIIRFGGDEFIVILSQTAPGELDQIINRIQKDFSKQLFKLNDAEFLVTFSAGVAIYPTDGESLEALLSSADKALYTAKQLGRNQCGFSEEFNTIEKNFSS